MRDKSFSIKGVRWKLHVCTFCLSSIGKKPGQWDSSSCKTNVVLSRVVTCCNDTKGVLG